MSQSSARQRLNLRDNETDEDMADSEDDIIDEVPGITRGLTKGGIRQLFCKPSQKTSVVVQVLITVWSIQQGSYRAMISDGEESTFSSLFLDILVPTVTNMLLPLESPVIEITETVIWNSCVIGICKFKLITEVKKTLGKPVQLSKEYLETLRPGQVVTPSRMKKNSFNNKFGQRTLIKNVLTRNRR